MKLFKTNSMVKKYYQSILLFLVAGLILSLGSCNPARKYEKAEKESIQSYLASNPNDTFQLKTSGLYYHDVLLGTGRAVATHDTAYVQYTGRFLNGNVFDTNVGSADLVFAVGEGYMISGFDEGISYMKAGGKATFLIPSSLAYGTAGYYTIPGYTALLYDVELVKVVPGVSK
jgi:FKBP-type peptidyl-prolyl cis-trans isomerase